jgi:hypothetical protein
VITERAVFFKGLLNKPGFTDVVVLVQEIEAGFPEGFTPYIGFSFPFAQHFPPGDNIALYIQTL